jgi:heme exporter protein A
MTMTILAHQVVKRFGVKTALRNLDFEATQGEFVALLGPNGAGKTTFLRVLSSLTRPTSGQVMVGGYPLPEQAAQARQQLGMVSHQPWLYGDLTAEENLRFFGRLYSVADLDLRIREVLAKVGLSDRRKEVVRTFSRGMQQRLSIGRAILHDPVVLLLDEPHTGLDQEACELLNDILVMETASGRTVIMTSHDLAQAANLATRFDIISHGKICASARREDLAEDGLFSFYRQALQAEKAAL